MAATCAAFEVEVLAIVGCPARDRGLMAGANTRLADAYARGMAEPAAHNFALINPAAVDALTRQGKTASFAAITGP